MKSLALISCLALLYGCASTPLSHQLETDGLGALPAAVELSTTPFFPQTQNHCGPAALATVLQAQGIATTPDELATQVYLPERQGSLQIEMTVSARRHGMLPYPLNPQLRDLFAEVAAGHPVLVLQNLAFAWYPRWHYAVVIGYDNETQDIILRSGTTRRWVTPFQVFERTWQRADHWALALVPVGEIPVTAEPLRYLHTAYAFEETGNQALALKAYQAASKRWPNNTASWMALGNLQFANQNWQAAIAAFNQATKLEPDAVNGWNNLAYALHAYGCNTQAQTALQCGLNTAPDNKNLQDSVLELSVQSVSSRPNDCPLLACSNGGI